jgi:AAA+ superfamily predicted ATPase
MNGASMANSLWVRESTFSSPDFLVQAKPCLLVLLLSYLWQRVEEYQGVVILATNLRKNMDDAFVRRMHFSIEFPFPNKKERRRIWEQIFPKTTPHSPDLDLDFMAQRFKIAGGNIRNIALASAFLAADDGEAISMNHLISATRREYQKMGKMVSEGEFGDYTRLA